MIKSVIDARRWGHPCWISVRLLQLPSWVSTAEARHCGQVP